MNLKSTKVQDNNNPFFASSKGTRFFNKNDLIYSSNENVSKLFIILNGEVESYTGKNNKENIKVLKKGSVLGLMDLILSRKYSKNMTAKSKVSLAIIDKDELEKKLYSNSFQFSLIKSLAIDVDKDKPNIWS